MVFSMFSVRLLRIGPKEWIEDVRYSHVRCATVWG